jgi:hypothetical protein
MPNLEKPTVDRFIAAWSETDDDVRRDLLAMSWAEDGKFYDGHVRIEGRSALNAHIADLLREGPERRLESRGWIEGLGGRAGFRWVLRSPNDVSAHGYAFAEVDETGRMTHVVSFHDSNELAPENGTFSRLRSWAVENPLSIGTIGLLLVYLSLRFQAERFYGSFDVSPEDAGFGPVELVVRRASDVLANFLKVGVIWSIGCLIVILPTFNFLFVRRAAGIRGKPYLPPLVFIFSLGTGRLITKALGGEWLLMIPGVGLFAILMLLPRLLYPEAKSERAETRSDLFRWGKQVFVYASLAMATWMFCVTGWFQASSDAQFVQDGGWVTDSSLPWQARPVNASWSTQVHPFSLPNCAHLVYLGGANGVAMLYEWRRDLTLRVNEADVHLNFPDPELCLEDRRHRHGKKLS